MPTSPLSPKDYESKVDGLDFILAPSFALDRPPDGLCESNISQKASKAPSQAGKWLASGWQPLWDLETCN